MPEGSKEMCKDIQESYMEDRYCRLFGLEPVNNEGWRVHVQEFRDGVLCIKMKI